MWHPCEWRVPVMNPYSAYGGILRIGDLKRPANPSSFVEQTDDEFVRVLLEMQSGRFRAQSIQDQVAKARKAGYRLIKVDNEKETAT